MTTASFHTPQVGSSKVTDFQVAFMVECYLRDSHFSRTLAEFRSEAASLLHPLRSVPKGARSLSAVLNDYVALKEEQISAAAEKARVEDLFNGLQEILSVYVAGAIEKNGVMAELENGKTAITFSPPHAVPSAANVQQSQLCGSVISEADNASAYADQHSKPKPSSSKRKSLDNTRHENLQLGNSAANSAKKLCRASNVKRPSVDVALTGNPVNVDSRTDTMSNMVNKEVQPATPPMSMANSSKLQQQQQTLPYQVASRSPQPSSLPTAIRSSLISTKHANTPTPLPSLRVASTQNHQDPQTPPSAPIKSSLSDNCLSAPIVASVKCETDTTTTQRKPSDEQQRLKASRSHLPFSTCPYALRAHRKPGSDPPFAALSDSKLKCTQKTTRKKANNSKCRLLDFSSAAEDVSKQVSSLTQGNGAGMSSSDVAEVSIISPTTFGTSADNLSSPQSGQVSDLSPSTQNSQESHTSDFAEPCDTFSFDELFDLDLDTSLISELEDIAAFTAGDENSPACLKTSDSLPLAPESILRGVLVDVSNNTHPDDATSLRPQCANPSASPSKLRKLAIGGDLDKENMHAVVVSSSSQTNLTS